MKYLIFVLALLLSTNAFASALPNKTLTPGAMNPDVRQDNIHQTICVVGYTATIRPSASYTNALKLKQIKQYKYKDKIPSHYEEDHDASLELGGHPRNPLNLWPQPYSATCGARQKDRLENRLHKLVCLDAMPLAVAQTLEITDWVAAYRTYVGKITCAP